MDSIINKQTLLNYLFHSKNISFLKHRLPLKVNIEGKNKAFFRNFLIAGKHKLVGKERSIRISYSTKHKNVYFYNIIKHI